MTYAGKEALQPFSATFPGHVEIFERAVILNTDFLPLNYHCAFFEKPALSGPISGFFKNKQRWGAEEQAPAPRFLGRNAVGEPAEALRPKVSLVLPSRPDWRGKSLSNRQR